MANCYSDRPELRFELNHPLMQRIVELKERNFRDKDQYDYAPETFEDALDSYDRVLGIVGDITATTIAENAEGVDVEGPHHEGHRVRYASGTERNLEAMVKAGMNGMTMPRQYEGLNFPITPYTMCAEIVAHKDAGFGNIWSLQDCIETLYEFGSEDQHRRFIPRICQGETMSMDLTEPDAGSDLQSVQLRATYSEEQGCWLLNGVKRFITNGDADLHLVLARSEEGTKDGRGLSMFIYDKRDGGVDVRRIEHKLGIHGSPTCELTYKNARAELVGSTRMGLIKYVMALMNGARLGIAAQSVGINITNYKLMAFIVSAVFAGMAGVLYALNFSSLVAKKFDYNTSILILVFVVLGGMGNIRGSVIAAALLTVLPELLRSMKDYRMLIYAIVLIVMMIFNQSPQIVSWRKKITAGFKAKRAAKKEKKEAA